jgi:rfaE bifunctional protein nucleotidyltransferase chain/domain
MYAEKIKSREEIEKISEKLKKQGKKIVTTNGSFDIMHSGHIKSLLEAKKYGNVLIVGLNSDSSIKQYKSKDRPIINQNERALMLSSLECVDHVVIFNETDPRELLKAIKPNFHVKSKSGYKGIEKDVVEQNNGKIVLIDDIPGISTTDLINKILKIYGK